MTLGFVAIMFAAPVLSPSSVELIQAETDPEAEEPGAMTAVARDLGTLGREKSVYFVRDPAHGCEYVLTTLGHITPRLGSDGKPICN